MAAKTVWETEIDGRKFRIVFVDSTANKSKYTLSMLEDTVAVELKELVINSLNQEVWFSRSSDHLTKNILFKLFGQFIKESAVRND